MKPHEASWLMDDFYVAAPDWWRTAGGALLDSVAHAARSNRQNRLIVVSAERDEAKNAMLRDRGFRQAAQWWVRPLDPPQSPVPAEGELLPMRVGPAPPVYDPGGPVALALDTDPAFAIDRFERQAFAAKAVLAIVPVRTADGTLTDVLAAAGYAVASVWYVRGPEEVVSWLLILEGGSGRGTGLVSGGHSFGRQICAWVARRCRWRRYFSDPPPCWARTATATGTSLATVPTPWWWPTLSPASRRTRWG